jgi:uncharacterized membrane protein
MSDTVLEPRRGHRLGRAFTATRGRLWIDRSEAAVALRVVYAGVVAYAALFVFAAVVHYVVFEAQRFDLGNMAQAIWNTLHGHFLETTTLNGHQRNRLGFHVDPFLLLFAPLLWIWSSPVLLLILQAAAVASGALPVFWLARKHLASPSAGAKFAFAYMIYPATQFNALTPGSDFHPVSFAVPLVLFAVWFLDEDRLIAFSAVAAIAFTTKEEIPLAVGCLGIWYAVRKGHRKFGLGVFATGLAVTLFNFLWVIPHFAAHGVNPYTGRYAGVGGTPGGMVHKLVTDPSAFVHEVATGHKAVYLAFLLVPFLGLWFLEPLILLGAVPDLAINLLTGRPEQTSISFQNTAGIIPFVVAASIFGAARVATGRRSEVSLWVLAGVASVAIYSPITFYLSAQVATLSSPRVVARERAVALIPSSAAVSASNHLAAYVSERRYIYEFPTVKRAGWMIVDMNDQTYVRARQYRSLVHHYELDKTWRTVFSSHGVLVLQRHSETTHP